MKRTVITLIIPITLLAFLSLTGFAQTPVETSKDAAARLNRAIDQSGDIEGFRREYLAFYQELLSVSRNIIPDIPDQALNSQAKAQMERQSSDVLRLISIMTPEEVALLRAAMSHYPDWRIWPSRINAVFTPEARQRLKMIYDRMATASANPNLINLSAGACTPPSVNNTNRILLNTANQASAGAEGVMQLIPEDIWTSVPYIVAAGVWGVLNIATVTGNLLYDSDNESGDAAFIKCQYDEFVAGFKNNNDKLDMILTKIGELKSAGAKTEMAVSGIGTDVTNIKNNVDVQLSTRATQASVNTVQATANIINIKSDGIQATANTIVTKADRIQATADTIVVKSDNIQASANTIITKADRIQATADTINGKSDQALMKLDDLISRMIQLDRDLSTLRVENRRMQIELNLLLGPRYNNVLFQTPRAQGGYLEEVYDIVKSAYDAAKTLQAAFAGSSLDLANSSLGQGKTLLDRGSYREAYALFRTAYLYISINTLTRQP